MHFKFVQADKVPTHIAEKNGEQVRFLVRSVETDARLSMIEAVLPAGSAFPWCYHEEGEEVLYILEGELEFQLADMEPLIARCGDVITAGPTVARRMQALTDVKMLVLNLPGSTIEAFLKEAMRMSEDQLYSEEYRAWFAEEYGVHLLLDEEI